MMDEGGSSEIFVPVNLDGVIYQEANFNIHCRENLNFYHEFQLYIVGTRLRVGRRRYQGSIPGRSNIPLTAFISALG